MLCRAVGSTQHNLYVWTSRIFIFCARKIKWYLQTIKLQTRLDMQTAMHTATLGMAALGGAPCYSGAVWPSTTAHVATVPVPGTAVLDLVLYSTTCTCTGTVQVYS